jgi:hypothetical protein
MPLTPRSRVYEQKLANSQKKARMRDEMAKSRFKGNAKPVESFSTSVVEEPMINAGLRGANFQRGGLAVEGAKTLLDWDTLKSAAQEPANTAKGFGKLALLSMGPGAAAGVLGPKEALAAMLMQDTDVQKASAVTGILPMGSAQRLAARGASKAMYAFEPSVMGFADDATENLLKSVLKRSAPRETQASREALAREQADIVMPKFEPVTFTGSEWQDIATGGPTGIVDEAFKKFFGRKSRVANVPSGNASQQRAGVEKTIAKSIESTNVDTISNRQAQALKALNDEIESEGLDPLPGVMELRMKGHADTMASPGSPSTYDPATVSRNTDVAMSTHGIAAGFDSPSLLRGDSKAPQHIMENDHLVGTGFAAWFLNKTKPKKITQDWRDEAAGFIDWINSGDNMQRVGRMWNQVKNGQDFETAMQQFKAQYQDAASGQFTDPYMSYVSSAFDSLKQTMGTKKGKEILNEWGSSDYAQYNAKVQQDRAAYIKAAKSMKDKEQAVKALISQGFSEDEAYGYIY